MSKPSYEIGPLIVMLAALRRMCKLVPLLLCCWDLSGPKKVLTRQVQGYRVERREDWSGSRRPMDRVVLCQVGPVPGSMISYPRR